MIQLPADVLYLVCEELSKLADFNTLFHCALASKALGKPALLWMYRIHNQSTIISSEGNDADLTRNATFEGRLDAQKITLFKWMLLWKSIIRSSLGSKTTAYPYCLYIRSLDLRNLAELLEELPFRSAQDEFFSDDMKQFLRQVPMTLKMRGSKGSNKRLDIPMILELVGESITSYVSHSASMNHATVALEDISGIIGTMALAAWTARLSKLKSMTLWDGAVLDQSVAEAISANCFDFDDLTFFTCLKGDVDHNIASFFSGLRSNTLKSFTALIAHALGPETLLSLNNHSQSLKRLKLDGLRSATVKNLSLLQGCVALEAIELTDADGTVDLEVPENDIFLEVIAWLSNCNGLQELLLSRFVSGPKILTQVCLKNNIRLKKLKVVDYPLAGNQDFHRALSHQTSLESLELRADPETAFRDDIDVLVSSVSALKSLKYLDLLSTSDYFSTTEILTLAEHLPLLEEIFFSGYDVTDALWPGVSRLPNLRSLNIHAVTSFSFNAILDYVSTLQDTNRGLLLSIMNQKPENAMSERHERAIRQAIKNEVDGKFEFTLFREPDSESDMLSD
ncbi:hypothetical protein MBM_07045 [Drepanopeziza brunnea f. sp. 'multigermtubi' MB_m1]|uniref:F-box domain-containing protein n=1 Tax=Marssonina brunnea f. sp. multigermtubi (strain MB_m1) TaxID=1072389 RepID=K1XQG0_MARBU|nr:uncharacterized protein MBM_07045 [Drepanopeziza brunnea f. sp. 'multigermtubi' MB_m1]EKD14834.1 hypothetical protein MBM_07045 [Drepanopeziza brunnea f. sp. 'multigermtubi' MB_m1]